MFAVRGLTGDLLGSLWPRSPRARGFCRRSPRDGPALSTATPGARGASTDGNRMEFAEGQVTLEVPHIRVERAKTISTGCGFESST